MALSNLLLLVNLGCEMIYIIEQRLTAQNILKDKSAQGEIEMEFFSLIFYTFFAFLSAPRGHKCIALPSVFPLHQYNFHG